MIEWASQDVTSLFALKEEQSIKAKKMGKYEKCMDTSKTNSVCLIYKIHKIHKISNIGRFIGTGKCEYFYI